MTIRIIGAGMAGLLAANILKDLSIEVLEQQKEVPNNHSALLRFRSNAVGEVLGLEFKKVKVTKWSQPFKNPVADALSYAFKCNGVAKNDRSISALETAERFIAPSDLIQRMTQGLDYRQLIFDRPFKTSDVNGQPLISTMPMPALMQVLDYPKKLRPEFRHCHGFTLSAELEKVDAYCTIYVPDPEFSFNRVSITGDRLIAEYAFPGATTLSEVEARMASKDASIQLQLASCLFGLQRFKLKSEPVFKMQKYSKILPIEETIGKNFMLWASARHNVWSIGRFATWRPGLLLDDLVKDVRRIRNWIQGGTFELMRQMF